jgi:bifunctional DNA-binding transcriptional regulator/antitoxin component of YhaV-PrlF toxin-antitoxin module
MKKRTTQVNISSAGGTASRGSKTYKVTLPNTWMSAMGIDEGCRELEIYFDGRQIVLSRCISGKEFAKRKLEQRHDVCLLKLYDNNTLCTLIYADFTDEELTIENYVSDSVKTAFGNNLLPSWDDFNYFLEERCIPRQRAGLREYLEVLGVDEYDPIEIIKKTAGRMAEDNQWLDMEYLK